MTWPRLWQQALEWLEVALDFLLLHRAFLVMVDDPPLALGRAGQQHLLDDLRQRLRLRFHRTGQRVAAEGAETYPARLDAGALGRAMDDERRLVDAQHAKRQQALLGALQKMSVEDRKAFAASSQMGRERMDGMMQRYRAGNGPTRATPPGTN